MKIWKWLLLTVTALASYAFALMFPFAAPLPSELATATAVWTSAPTLGVETQAPLPTHTALPLPSPTVAPAPTQLPSPTPVFTAYYAVQTGTPVYITMFRQPELSCGWMGIAGQVFDREGQPVSGIVVVVEGEIGKTSVNVVGVTGAVAAYGPGGYELQLSTTPAATSGSLAVTLFDLTGQPLTQPQFFDTKAACNQNLVLINFQEQ